MLNQSPSSERPPDEQLSRWAFEKLKRVRALALVIERIKESRKGCDERTFDYLWRKVNRLITESQHDSNLDSMRDLVRKGPHCGQ